MHKLLVTPVGGALAPLRVEQRTLLQAELHTLGVSAEARRIGAQQGVAWNALLFVQVVGDEISKSRTNRRPLSENRLAPGDSRGCSSVPDSEVPTWILDRMQEIAGSIQWPAAAVTATNRAFADPEQGTSTPTVVPLVEAAREWGSLYRRYLDWAFRARFTPLPGLWCVAQSKLRTVVNPILATLESAPDDWRRAVRAAREARVSGTPPKINITISLQLDATALQAALQDLERTIDVARLAAAFGIQPG